MSMDYRKLWKLLIDRNMMKKDLREKLKEIAGGVRVAVIHESPFRITDLTETIADEIPEAELCLCCDLTKVHEKTLRGSPASVLEALRENPKTEKGAGSHIQMAFGTFVIPHVSEPSE